MLEKCLLDLTVNGDTYPGIKLGVLKNLCCDVLLGSDFQSCHKRVIFEYNGPKPYFVAEKYVHPCPKTPSFMEPAKLLSILLSDCQPIAVKSRQYNVSDRAFIYEETVRLSLEGIIRPS